MPFVEDVEFMLGHREHPLVIAQRLGLRPGAITTRLYRLGRPDLAKTFAAHRKYVYDPQSPGCQR